MVVRGEIQGIFCIGSDVTELITSRKSADMKNHELIEKNQQLDIIAFEQSHLVRASLSNILGLVRILKNLHVDVTLSNIINMIDESANKFDDVIKKIVLRSKHGHVYILFKLLLASFKIRCKTSILLYIYLLFVGA